MDDAYRLFVNGEWVADGPGRSWPEHFQYDEIDVTPYLAAGATTVWEVFPTSRDHPGGFPTRSHCHAWSSAPLRFLPRIVLGILQAEAGGAAYTISPWLGDLEWGRGAVCAERGLLEVSWRKEKGACWSA